MFSMTTVEAVIASYSHTGRRLYRHIFMVYVCVSVCVGDRERECLAADSPGGTSERNEARY